MVALVERMLGQIVRRNLDFTGRIHVQEFLRRLAGVVRSIESHIHEEGVVPLSRAVRQVVNGAGGPGDTGVLNRINGPVQPEARMDPVTR